MNKLISIRSIEPGIEEHSMDLSMIYLGLEEMNKFNARWEKFYDANGQYKSIFTHKGHQLIYQTENLIPTRVDNRLPILLIFGNPASHSVVSKMCFAFEGDKQEHRIWPVLRKSGWLKFFSDDDQIVSWQMRNSQRKEEFFDLNYYSPFRLGITVCISFPSPASDLTWAGVSGVKKVFGQKAFRIIEMQEKERLQNIIRSFLIPSGTVVTFQSNAYELLRTSDSPRYSILAAKSGGLVGTADVIGRNVLLFGLPPTRYAHTLNFYKILENIKERIITNY